MIRETLFCLIALGCAMDARGQEIVWRFDNLSTIGGHSVTVVGTPRVVDTERGKAVEFNGATDGLFFDVNPLAGLKQFTVEIEFQPAADGAEEQRFGHFQEATTENRAPTDLRVLPGAAWSLGTESHSTHASRPS